MNCLEILNCYVQNKFNLNDTVAAIPESSFSTHGKIVKINWTGKKTDIKKIKEFLVGN